MPRSFEEFISNAVSGERKLNEILKIEDQHGYRAQSPEINALLDFNSTYRQSSKARKEIGSVIANICYTKRIVACKQKWTRFRITRKNYY